jgi:3',5'-cyclic AMP phosphodiesterase CpdA
VRGLRPGAKYQITALTTAANDGEQHTSESKRFTTLDEKAVSTEFVIWNDTHIHNDTIQDLHAATPSADFLIWNGDTCNNWTSPDLFIPTLLNPGGRDITHGRPLFITWGNHDVRGPHAFEMPELIATPFNRPFYAFRSGPVALICLHTGEDKPDSHPSFQGRVAFEQLRQEQAKWLAQVIHQPGFQDAPYRIVVCHIPLRWRDESPQDYDNGGFDRYSLPSRQLWHSSLVEWKTQLVISGHTHQHAWLPATEQFPYGQLIGGGPQKKAATWMHAEFQSHSGKITVQNLEGKTLHEVNLEALS